MATPTGGFRRTFTDAVIDITGNTTSTVYTCPADKKALFQIRAARTTTAHASNTTMVVTLRQDDSVGGNLDQQLESLIHTNLNPVIIYEGFKHDSGQAFQYFLYPGDTIRIGPSNDGRQVRYRYVVIEEENSDI